MENMNFIKATEVASILKISKAYAFRLIAEGQIPSLRIGRSVRVRSEDLDKFIQDNMSGQGLPAPNSGLSMK